jgi:cytochrome c-type biogenesis protein
MGEALLTGSALAAFLAGTVAFFAPCCAFVMLPTYLASVTGANRWRTAALTAVFVAGVATVVWPLTIGAAGLSQLIAVNHETMFVLGGVMMLAVGAATLRGWMWNHAPSVGGGDPSGVVGIYGMGVFAGAATACCAPVLAGAVAIAGVSGSWWAGALLGGFYLLGLVTPLLLSALGIVKLRGRVRDPRLSFALIGRTIQMTLSRLVGGMAFIVLGAALIALALTGDARTAPGAQRDFGQWLTARANDLNELVPTGLGWALMLVLVAGLAYASVRALRHPPVATHVAVGMSSHTCCEENHTINTTSQREGATH